MGMIRVTPQGDGFFDESTGKRFTPIGVNYAATIGPVRRPDGSTVRISALFGQDEHTAPGGGLAEGKRMVDRISSLGLNIVRIWLEPGDFFPVGERLDPHAADQLHQLLDYGLSHGVRFVLGMHLSSLYRELVFHQDLYAPPHQARQLHQLYALARRFGAHEGVFSWSIIGEGTLPWQSPYLASLWPTFLEYWYCGDLKLLKEAWGRQAFYSCSTIYSFRDAPIPPRPVGLDIPLTEFAGRMGEGTLPHDPWAGSTWRYDWRLMLEEVGAQRVRAECDALRHGGAKQMLTVGNNCWFHPCLPAGWMGLGYHPYFYLDDVDYLCQHNYAFFQAMPGFAGDPLDSDAAMQYWLHSMDIMGRFYSSMGKPVMLEEWGWYGGNASRGVDCTLPHRSEEAQARFCDLMMQATHRTFSGWLNWTWRDMPGDLDITNASGVFAADGNRVKPWGKLYSQWADRFHQTPPSLLGAVGSVNVDMKRVLTCDRAVDQFFREQCATWDHEHPRRLIQVYERKPMTDVLTHRRATTERA